MGDGAVTTSFLGVGRLEVPLFLRTRDISSRAIRISGAGPRDPGGAQAFR